MHVTQIQRVPLPQQLLQPPLLLRRLRQLRLQLRLQPLRQLVQRIVTRRFLFVLMGVKMIKDVNKIVKMLIWYVYCVVMVFVNQRQLQQQQYLLPRPKKGVALTNATLNSRNVSINAMGTRNVRAFVKIIIWHV